MWTRILGTEGSLLGQECLPWQACQELLTVVLQDKKHVGREKVNKESIMK